MLQISIIFKWVVAVDGFSSDKRVATDDKAIPRCESLSCNLRLAPVKIKIKLLLSNSVLAIPFCQFRSAYIIHLKKIRFVVNSL